MVQPCSRPRRGRRQTSAEQPRDKTGEVASNEPLDHYGSNHFHPGFADRSAGAREDRSAASGSRCGEPGCRRARDGPRRRHLGADRRRSRQRHRRRGDAAGLAGRRQGRPAEHHRSQAAARHRHGDPADRCARLCAAAKPVSRHRILGDLYHQALQRGISSARAARHQDRSPIWRTRRSMSICAVRARRLRRPGSSSF